MRLELTGRHITINPALRKTVAKRIARLTRLMNDRAVSLQVVIAKEKGRHKAEMTLHARGEHFFHAAASGRDLDTAVSLAADKIEHQALKLKSRWVEGRRQGVSAAKAASATPRPERARRAFGNGGPPTEADAPPLRIIRARRYAVKPMSVDEAALEVGPSDEAFLVFRNASTDTINVLYRRPDGNLGLIEPEA